MGVVRKPGEQFLYTSADHAQGSGARTRRHSEQALFALMATQMRVTSAAYGPGAGPEKQSGFAYLKGMMSRC